MPFFFVVVGIMLVVTGVKNTHVAFGKQVASDFTGDRNFFVWVTALGSLGAIGYVPKLRPFANTFMALVIVAMVLSNSRRGDILTLIQEGLNNPVAPPRPDNGTTAAGVPTTPRSGLAGEQPVIGPRTGPSDLDIGAEKLEKGAKILGTVAKIFAMFAGGG